MLKGQVRLRVLLPSGLITGIALSAYALSATLWMPNNVTSNDRQYGIFGVALALVDAIEKHNERNPAQSILFPCASASVPRTAPR